MELSPTQIAIDTLVDSYRQSRRNPKAQEAFVQVALVLAQKDVLDYLMAAILKQAQVLDIPPTKSLLFRDMAFEVERKLENR
jgi:hypothetical protein